MKTKTLSLVAVLASMLVAGCGNDNSSSNKPSVPNSVNPSSSSNVISSSTKPSTDDSTQEPGVPKGYTSVLTSKEVEARGVPSDMGLEAVKNYNSAFVTGPNTFDYLANNKQTNSEYYANFVDNLLEHDQYGQIRGALAEGAYYNKDYTRLRFKLREGVQWVTAAGQEYGEIVADDFKAGLQHLLDAKGGAETLAYYIMNAKKYADGEETNFNNVGLRVINDYEFEYILERPCPFFHTFFEYTSFLPLNREFFEALGGAFGSDWNPSDCDFGKVSRTDTILYCGPYILTNYSEGSTLSMKKNTSYWDIGNVQIDNVNYVYTSGTDVTGLVNLFKENKLSSLGVNNQNIEAIQKEYPEHMFAQGTGTTTYYFNWNLNRSTYAVGDCISAKTTNAEKENTKKAILNENFRKAIFSSIPKIQMNALADDADTATVCVRNTYTTPEFVNITSSVTTDVNGVTHDAGSYYYQMVNNEMKAINEVTGDEFGLYASEWDPATSTESSSETNESTFNDKENSYYNEGTARILRNKAKNELQGEVTFPVKIDYLTYSASDIFLGQANLLKQRVESILGSDFVTINLQTTANENNYQNSHFMAATGSAMNFDLSSGTGWGPDYGDPATFLNTLAWEGDLQNNLGFDDNAADELKYNEVLGTYNTLFQEASAITDDTNLRYAKLAAAEAELLHSAVIMPNTTDGGGYAVSRIVPRTNQRTFYGTDDSRFKYMVIVDQVLTVAQREAIIADWEADYKAAEF